MPFPMYQ
ncbi:unnamed protein product [Candida parapsilosis]